MFKRLYGGLTRRKDWFHIYKKEIKLASNIVVHNKLLYQELEQACKKHGGILTYAEYVTIDQFGKHGYYATNTRHGKTDVEKRWGDALAAYCNDFGYTTIIEIGCGTGDLGIATVKAYTQQTDKQVRWIGVEIDKRIHTKIFDNFISHNVRDSIDAIVSSIDELPATPHALIVFPYCLDGIPPQVFLNTQSEKAYPNALLGISVANGKLSEVIIPPTILKKKGINLENGYFTQNNHTYKLTSWKLRKGQRAYIPTDAYSTILDAIKKFGRETAMIIIDEFRTEPWFFYLDNLGTPKSLYEDNLVCNERLRYYRESGKNNLYFPLYKESLFTFLSLIGFQSVHYEVEQKKAAQLRGKQWVSIYKKYSTLVFLAKNLINKKITTIPIPFDPQRIL